MKAAKLKTAVERDKSILLSVVGNDHLTLVLRVLVDADSELIETRVTFEQCCPEPARRRLAVWCNDHNWNIIGGFFSVDQESGEIRVRDMMAVRQIAVTNALICSLVRRTVTTVFEGYDELIQIVESGRRTN
jgi:hypothetical protein